MKSGIDKSKIWKLLLLLSLILLLGYGLGKVDLSAKKPAKVECLGKEELSAPVFSLPDLKGDRVDLVSFKGQVIILEFWATWCGPCREEIPVLNQLYRKYKDRGLVVIGISLDRKEPQEVKNSWTSCKSTISTSWGGRKFWRSIAKSPNWARFGRFPPPLHRPQGPNLPEVLGPDRKGNPGRDPSAPSLTGI